MAKEKRRGVPNWDKLLSDEMSNEDRQPSGGLVFSGDGFLQVKIPEGEYWDYVGFVSCNLACPKSSISSHFFFRI